MKHGFGRDPHANLGVVPCKRAASEVAVLRPEDPALTSQDRIASLQARVCQRVALRKVGVCAPVQRRLRGSSGRTMAMRAARLLACCVS